MENASNYKKKSGKYKKLIEQLAENNQAKLQLVKTVSSQFEKFQTKTSKNVVGANEEYTRHTEVLTMIRNRTLPTGFQYYIQYDRDVTQSGKGPRYIKVLFISLHPNKTCTFENYCNYGKYLGCYRFSTSGGILFAYHPTINQRSSVYPRRCPVKEGPVYLVQKDSQITLSIRLWCIYFYAFTCYKSVDASITRLEWFGPICNSGSFSALEKQINLKLISPDVEGVDEQELTLQIKRGDGINYFSLTSSLVTALQRENSDFAKRGSFEKSELLGKSVRFLGDVFPNILLIKWDDDQIGTRNYICEKKKDFQIGGVNIRDLYLNHESEFENNDSVEVYGRHINQYKQYTKIGFRFTIDDISHYAKFADCWLSDFLFNDFKSARFMEKKRFNHTIKFLPNMVSVLNYLIEKRGVKMIFYCLLKDNTHTNDFLTHMIALYQYWFYQSSIENLISSGTFDYEEYFEKLKNADQFSSLKEN